MVADFLIHNTSEILTCAGPAPRIGPRQADAGSRPNAVIAAHRGTIVFVGDDAEWRRVGTLAPDALVIDAEGGAVVPGFVDPHTHVVFAGDRRDELRRRLGGASYAEIAAAGGGIVASVQATRAATDGELAAQTRVRLDEMLRCGTTTCEAKSGYALTTDGELKMLRTIRTLGQTHAIELSPTFMGAHEVPVEYRGRRRAYVDVVIQEMIPAVARAGLAEWCDVFCEGGVFTPEESREILEAGRAAGLAPRIHADELAASGGSTVAAAVGARSADHLIFVDEAAAAGLAAAGVVATLLPIAAFYLKLGRFAPARMLIARGVAVAIATDVNPGAGYSPSMPFAMTLACFGMHLTFEEALVAATINAACALDRQDRIGSLEAGKQMDAVIVHGPAINLIRVGADTIRAVVKRGRIVADNGNGGDGGNGIPFSPSLPFSVTEQEMPMSLTDKTLRDLLTAFSSSDPTPGGGSASALASAVGVSLLTMVAGLPKTRTGSDDDRAALAAASTVLADLARRLTDAIDADSAAYDRVVAAYRMPKASPEQQRERKDAIQQALRGATDVPLDVVRLSAAALEQARAIAAHGHRAAASDIGVAIALLRAGIKGARLNVEINLSSVSQPAYADAIAAETAGVTERAARAADEADALL